MTIDEYYENPWYVRVVNDWIDVSFETAQEMENASRSEYQFFMEAVGVISQYEIERGRALMIV